MAGNLNKNTWSGRPGWGWPGSAPPGTPANNVSSPISISDKDS